MAKEVITYGNVTSGTLHIVAGDERNQFVDAFKDWKDCEVELIVRQLEPKRSDPANRYYFGVIVPIARKTLNEEWGELHSKDKIHEILKGESNLIEHETKSGRVVMVPRDTHDMPHSEFCEYVERCRRWLKEFFDVNTPDPDKLLKTKTKLKV